MKNFTYSLNLLNDKLKNNPDLLVKEDEEYYFNQLDEAVENTIKNTEGRRLVMVAGPSSSGKTTTAAFLGKRFAEKGLESVVISLDDFYKSRELAPKTAEGEFDFETVHALDIDEMKSCLTAVVTEGYYEAPLFDFMTGAPKTEKKIIKIGENGVVIVEGLHALNPLVVSELPEKSVYKIYVTVKSTVRNTSDEHVISRRGTRLSRRIIRDYKYRNCSPTDTLDMWKEVEEGENKYLFPFESDADYTIDSFHPYELGIMKEEVVPLLETIPPETESYDRIERLKLGYAEIETLSIKYLPTSSLLMEFLG